MVSIFVTSGTYILGHWKAKNIQDADNYLIRNNIIEKGKSINDFRSSYFERGTEPFCDYGFIVKDGKQYYFRLEEDGRKLRGYDLIS